MKAKEITNVKLNTENINGETIQLLFKYIKKDDISNFKALLHDYPGLLFFKNKQKENLLFYSIQRAAVSISQYLLDKQEKFLYEKNRYGLTPFSNLIYTNNHNGLEKFRTIIEGKDSVLSKCYHIDGEQYTIPMLAVLKLNAETWGTFSNITRNLWSDNDLTQNNHDGMNIAHLIAKKNADYALPILDNCPTLVYQQIDKHSGSTPLLIAAGSANAHIANYFLKHSDPTTTNLLGSSIIHLACDNPNYDTLDLFLKQPLISPTRINTYQDTALKRAIVNKNEKHVMALLPFYEKEDISLEVMEIIKSFPKKVSFVDNIIVNLQENHIQKLSEDKDNLANLFSYIFYYYNEEQFKKMQGSDVWKKINIITDDKLLCHQLLTSAITGRKVMALKVQTLSQYNNFMSAEDSDGYFTPIQDNTNLLFSGIKGSYFNKPQKSFCLVAALGNLPVSQIKEIITKTTIFEGFPEADKLLFYSIAIKKNSPILLQHFNHVPENYIVEGSNIDLAIQANLSSNNGIDLEEVKLAFNAILKGYSYIPEKFVKDITTDICDSRKPLPYLNELFLNSPSPIFKKFVSMEIMNTLAQRDDNVEILENLFSKNPKLIHYYFETQKDIFPKIKNNQFLNKLLTNYSTQEGLLKLSFKIAQTDNVNQEILVEKILRLINPREVKIDKNKLTYEIPQFIEDNIWRKTLNYFHKTENFNLLVNLYIEQQAKFLKQTNLDTVKIATALSPKINVPIIIKNLAYNYFDKNNCNDLLEKKLMYFIDIINPSKDKDLYQKLAIEGVKHGNFGYIYTLCATFPINLEKIQLENYWQNNNLKNNIDTGYTAFNNYFNFLTNHDTDFTQKFWEKSATNFCQWLTTDSSPQLNKVEITSLFFKAVEEHIWGMPDDAIIKICSYILNGYSTNNNMIYLNDKGIEKLEEMLEFVFQNKNHEFFVKLYHSPDVKDNLSSFPINQQKQLNYHLLKESMNNSKTNSLPKKKNKI